MAAIITAIAAALSKDRPERECKELEQKILEEARRAAAAECKAEEQASAKDKSAPERLK